MESQIELKDEETSFNIFPYKWDYEDIEGRTNINIFGLNDKNRTVYVRVDSFTPYMYLELPPHVKWTEANVRSITSKIKEMSNPAVISFMYKYRLYYAHVEKGHDGKYKRKLFPYLFIAMNSKDELFKLTGKLRRPIKLESLNLLINVKVHEMKATPILQLIANQEIPSAGWISGKGISPSMKDSEADEEYHCEWSDLKPCTDTEILKIVPRPKLMSFDLEVNSKNWNQFPRASRLEDCIFQIGVVSCFSGDKEDKYRKDIFTLKHVNPDKLEKGLGIHEYKTESDLLCGFFEFIKKEKPNIMLGYNIFNFDLPYIMARENRVYCPMSIKRCGLLPGVAKEVKIKWASSAFSAQTFTFPNLSGILFVDMFPVLKRDVKAGNYRLNTMAGTLLGDKYAKDPLTHKGIFKCYKIGTPDIMSIVGRYCVQDSNLTLLLFEKLFYWFGLTEMATISKVPILYLYTQGQQVKMFSNVYAYCTNNNFVCESDVFQASETDRYTGAIVIPPKPGMYEKLIPFDFASLYPSRMIAGNLDYSSYVIDDDIPDSDCHTFDWDDHYGCLAEGTLVTLNQATLPIEKLNSNSEHVLSWNGNGLIYQLQTAFLDQGNKECVKLTFQDGTELICTPDHRILTSSGEWKEAQDLNVNIDKIKQGITYKYNNSEKDLKLCNKWTLELGPVLYSTNNYYELNKTLKFMRLLGLSLTDGHIEHNRTTLYAGHMLDVNDIVRDIEYISNKPPTITRDENVWKISLPQEIGGNIHYLPGVSIGRKRTQRDWIPDFILDSQCPLPIIREFLRGLFGGDGKTCSYSSSSKTVCSVSIGQTRDDIDHGYKIMKDISYLLSRFNIKSIINNHKPEENGYWFNLHIPIEDLIKFHDEIGFVYCVHKSYRLFVAVSYFKYRAKVYEQNDYVVDRVNELKNDHTILGALEQAHLELKIQEPIYNDKYSLPNKTMVIDRNRSRVQNKKRTLHNKYFPSCKEYLESIDAFYLFTGDEKVNYAVHRDETYLPTINLKLIDRRNVGIKKVYDISVKETQNFLANGIIVHNCEHDEEKRKVENPLCAHQHHRFLKEPIGVIPTILMNYISARKKTKKEMEIYEEKVRQLKKEGKTETDEYIKAHTLATVLDKRQLALKVSANSMYGATGVRKGFLPFMPIAMCTTAGGRAALLKAVDILKNRYGAEVVYGDSVTPDTPILCRLQGKIFYRTIDNLPVKGDWIEHNPDDRIFFIQDDKEKWIKYNDKECREPVEGLEVWNDGGFTKLHNIIRHKSEKKIYKILTHTGLVCVTEDHSLLTPMKEKIKPINVKVGTELLHYDLPVMGGDKKINCPYSKGLFYGDGSCGYYKCPSGKKRSWAINNTNLDYLNKAKKELEEYYAPKITFKILDTMKSSAVYKLVAQGDVKFIVTEWRELFYDKRKYKIVPDEMFEADEKSRRQFFIGYYSADGDKDTNGYTRCDNKGQIGSAGLYHLFNSVGYKVSLNTRTDKPDIYRLTCTGGKQRKNIDAIKKIEEIPNTYDYVYDLTTENHHFSAGIGRMVVHNTDSSFVKLPLLTDPKEIYLKAKQIEKEMLPEFPPPMKLEFEGKLYWRFFILTKKRYMTQMCDENGVVIDKIKQRGVLPTRRDHSKFVQDGYLDLEKMFFKDEKQDKVLEYIRNRTLDLYRGRFDYKQFIVSKTVNNIENYKPRALNPDPEKRKAQLQRSKCKDEHEYMIKSLPAHAQLAMRMEKRGLPIEAGTRLEYLVTTQGGFYGKMFQKIEDPSYYHAHRDVLSIDYNYYCKAMINPYDELLEVRFGITGFVKQLHRYHLRHSEMIQQFKKIFRTRIVAGK